MNDVNGDFEDRLEHCRNLDGKKERSACLWDIVFDIEVFTDEVRRHMPCGTAIEPLASAIVERCVDVSREIAKGMKHNEVDIISWEYIDEKAGRLDRNIEDMQHDIKVFRMRELPDRIEYPDDEKWVVQCFDSISQQWERFKPKSGKMYGVNVTKEFDSREAAEEAVEKMVRKWERDNEKKQRDNRPRSYAPTDIPPMRITNFDEAYPAHELDRERIRELDVADRYQQ